MLIAFGNHICQSAVSIGNTNTIDNMPAVGIDTDCLGVILTQNILLNLHHFAASASLAYPIKAKPDVGRHGADRTFRLEVMPQTAIKRVVKAVECNAQIRQHRPRDRRPRLDDRDGVNIGSDDIGAHPDCLVQGSAATHHRVQHQFALQTAGRVVIAAAGIRRKLLQYGPESRAATPRPPLVQVSIRAKQVFVEYLLSGQGVDKLLREGAVSLDAVPRLLQCFSHIASHCSQNQPAPRSARDGHLMMCFCCRILPAIGNAVKRPDGVRRRWG